MHSLVRTRSPTVGAPTEPGHGESWPEERDVDHALNKGHPARSGGKPAVFRTELLEDASTTWLEPSIEGYAESTRQTVAACIE